MKQKINKIKILSWAIFIIVCALFVLVLFPFLSSYNNSEMLSNYIESFGTWGAFVLLLIQIVQIVIAIIPGTPKDALTYFVPMTKMTLKQFLLLSGIARIPSIISSVYAGATFAEGNFIKTALIYIIIGLVSVTGIFIHHKLFNKGEKNG